MHTACRAIATGAALLALAAPAAALELVLRDQADVRGPGYTLGEIAELRDADAPTRARLAALTIGQVPREGQTAIVTRDALEPLLRHLAMPQATWSGAAQTLVRPAGVLLDAERVTDSAAAALFAAWAGSLEGLEARPLSPPPAVSVPPGSLRLEARLPADAAVARRVLVHVDASVDGRPVATLPVWFAVRAWRSVRLARVPLQRGDSPGEASFVRALREVTAYPTMPLPADAPLAGLRLRTALAVDMPLTAAWVESRPAVARNESVHVRMQAGTVQLDTIGIALADARIGEQVRVMNPSSHDAYSARVVADGAVLASER